MKKYYFLTEDAEYCYTADYWQYIMKNDGLNKIEVYEAVPFKDSDLFWCAYYGEASDLSFENPCGSICTAYAPRNGVSGWCKHHKKTMYSCSDVKVTLTRNI